jgi:hypothetical protein
MLAHAVGEERAPSTHLAKRLEARHELFFVEAITVYDQRIVAKGTIEIMERVVGVDGVVTVGEVTSTSTEGAWSSSGRGATSSRPKLKTGS